MLCGATLEIVFVTIAKFKSFARFPLSFRREARWLLMACLQYRLSRDVRVLLVRALSKCYDRPVNQGPLLFEADKKGFARVEIFGTAQSGRVVVHVFNYGTAPLSLADSIRCGQRWTVTGGGKGTVVKRKPEWNPVLPEVAVAPGCGFHAAVNLNKYFRMQIDSVRCVTNLRERDSPADVVFEKDPPRKRVIAVEFELKL